MRSLFCVLILLSGSLLFSQTIIKGTITDNDTKRPISEVVVTLNANERTVLSDSLGIFKIVTASKQFNLIFKKLGYAETRLTLEKSDSPDLNIVLSKKAFELAEVEISSEKRSAVIQNKRFFVEDYFILPGQAYLLVTHYMGQNGFNLMLGNAENKIKYSHKITGEENGELFLDCLGNIHLLSQTFARQVYLNSDSTFTFLPAVSRGMFDSTIAPCTTKIDKNYFFTSLNPSYTFEREGVKVKVNSNAAIVYKIEKQTRMDIKKLTYDKRTVVMFNDELNYQEQRKKTPGVRYSPTDILFPYQAIYIKIYTPVFNVRDTLVIFDIYEKQIHFFTKDGKPDHIINLGEDYATFHGLKFVFDRVTSQVYVLFKFNSGQYLRKVDLATGKLFPAIKLYNEFADKIQVYNSDIYYILKDHIDYDGTSYLYKQRF
ncbi:MAG: carboxypeptidase-like regulatory domain-containing protein [Bacteroidota bacterium]